VGYHRGARGNLNTRRQVLPLRAWSWAALMHRAFSIDVLACAHRGGRLRLIATLHDPGVIRKILAHLALGHSGQSPGRAPPKSGAAASWSDRHRDAANAVLLAPRGGIRAASADPPVDWRRRFVSP